MKRIPLISGNWKMNKTVAQAVDLVDAMLPGLQRTAGVDRVICPAFIALAAVAERLRGSGVLLGAQHMHWEPAGAYTGEVSPTMLVGLCSHVIVGHSERRTFFGETDETVRRRVVAGLEHGLRMIVCIGESLAENEAGQTAAVVGRQIRSGLAGLKVEHAGSLVIAYEPVWAIGTGRAATAAGANTVISDFIRPALAEVFGAKAAADMRVVYGGSVTAANAAEFFGQPDIDGALVGGASLKPEEFVAIVSAAQS